MADKIALNKVSSSTECEEIKINVPWGHIAGKWHGSKMRKPVLAIHGWQDNAGTFDTLIPLLPDNISVLAIELPGHGFSSPIPHGMHYHASDFLFIVKIVMDNFNWQTIGILGHSLGAMIAFNFAAVYPERVDFAILIDALKPHVRPPKVAIDFIRGTIEKFFELDKRNQSTKEPPSYTYEECVDKVHEGTFTSVSKSHAKYLLNRNLKKSEIHPDKYYFLRDGRLKVYEVFNHSQQVSNEMAKRVRAPFMLIKARGENTTYYEEKKYFYETVNIMKKNNPSFRFHTIPGSHHVHLCEPEKVANLVIPFLEKFYSTKEELKSKL